MIMKDEITHMQAVMTVAIRVFAIAAPPDASYQIVPCYDA